MRACADSAAAALQEEQVSSTKLEEQGTLQVTIKEVSIKHVRIWILDTPGQSCTALNVLCWGTMQLLPLQFQCQAVLVLCGSCVATLRS